MKKFNNRAKSPLRVDMSKILNQFKDSQQSTN